MTSSGAAVSTTTIITAFPNPWTVVREIWTDWDGLVGDISAMQSDQPFWISKTFLSNMMLPAIIGTAVACTAMYLISYYVLADRIFPKEDMATKERKSRAAAQLTNMLFNSIIGSLGIYYEFWVLPTLSTYYIVMGRGDNMDTTTVATHLDRIPGHEEYFYLVSAMQFGYQCWAFPMGILVIKEPFEMILHHLAVVVASTLSGFTNFGFRYYTPYFYGIMELSSVPLAIMNAFKDSPTLMKRHPVGYLVARAVFSFGFLHVRIVMWYTRGPVFLRDLFFVAYTLQRNWTQKLFMFSAWVGCMVLGVLIHWWAYLVLKGQFSWFKKFFQTLFRNLTSSTKDGNKTKKI